MRDSGGAVNSAVVTSAHSGLGWGIVVGIFLGSEGRIRDAEGFEPGTSGDKRGTYGDADAVQEIATRDRR